MDTISGFSTSIQSIISQLKDDLKTVRTGRANPSIIENLIVETYGGQTKLKLMELSTIATEGPSQIVIVPFDPSTTADIEKAILKSPLGLSPQTQGNRIIVRIPSLSQEQREKMTKLVAQKIEEKKEQIRINRDEVRKKFKNQFELKEIGEDEKYRLEKEIDSVAQKYSEELNNIKKIKETDIMEV